MLACEFTLSEGHLAGQADPERRPGLEPIRLHRLVRGDDQHDRLAVGPSRAAASEGRVSWLRPALTAPVPHRSGRRPGRARGRPRRRSHIACSSRVTRVRPPVRASRRAPHGTARNDRGRRTTRAARRRRWDSPRCRRHRACSGRAPHGDRRRVRWTTADQSPPPPSTRSSSATSAAVTSAMAAASGPGCPPPAACSCPPPPNCSATRRADGP